MSFCLNCLPRRLRRPLQKRLPALGTIEIVIIIAILIGLALLFRKNIQSFAESLMSKVFDTSILDQLGTP